jgi:predicted phosphoribosyltransferase
MFLNRIDAWEKLKTFIENYIQEKWIKKDDVVVVFLPRGGLPVAYPFLLLGQEYVDFSQVSDEEFIKFLNLLKRW